MQLKLYSYFRSSCSWRVRAVLAYKGISYETEGINLIKDGGQQHSEDFKRLNPMEQVPALLVGDRCLTQSISIMEYLEEVYPDPPMLPKDPLGRAKVREICEVIASGVQPLQNLAVLQKIGKDQGEEKKIEWAKEVISKGLEAVEKLMQDCSGKYCFGDEVTFADCCLIPQVYNAMRFGVSLEPFPTIHRIDLTLKDHPAFVASHPSNQPDCPPELRS